MRAIRLWTIFALAAGLLAASAVTRAQPAELNQPAPTASASGPRSSPAEKPDPAKSFESRGLTPATGGYIVADLEHIAGHVLEYRLTAGGALVWTSPKDGRIHALSPEDPDEAGAQDHYTNAVQVYLESAGPRAATEVRAMGAYSATRRAGEIDPDEIVFQNLTPAIHDWIAGHPHQFRIAPQGALMWTMPTTGQMVWLQPTTMPENTPLEIAERYWSALEQYQRAEPRRYAVEVYASEVFRGKVNPHEPLSPPVPDSSLPRDGAASAAPPAASTPPQLPPGGAERFANCLACGGKGTVNVPADSPFNSTGKAMVQTCGLCGGTGKAKGK